MADTLSCPEELSLLEQAARTRQLNRGITTIDSQDFILIRSFILRLFFIIGFPLFTYYMRAYFANVKPIATASIPMATLPKAYRQKAI
jgi:hypothetical protein